MPTLHKLGWFWIGFVVWFFILVVLMHGCTPYGPKAEAQQTDDVRGQMSFTQEAYFQGPCIIQYKILKVRHDNLLLAGADLNALAREGWHVIDADWLKSGTVMHGLYTLERCSSDIYPSVYPKDQTATHEDNTGLIENPTKLMAP